MMNVVDGCIPESSTNVDTELKSLSEGNLNNEDSAQQKDSIPQSFNQSETEKQHGETETETGSEIKLVIDDDFYQDVDENEEFEATESIDTLKVLP